MMRPPRLGLSFLAVLAAVFACGCGSAPLAPPISVSLTPASAQTDETKTIGITATLTNDAAGKGVAWSLTGPGSLSGESTALVTYNAPSGLSSPTTATITATSLADVTKTASVQITVNLFPQITTSSLPSGTVGTPYNQPVLVSGGTQPFTWSVPFGALPMGLTISPSTGAISGMPAGGGTWNFEILLTDAAGITTVAGFADNITINSNSPPGNPVPFISLPLAPDAVAPGSAGFTLTVNGAGFLPGATVNFNGAALSTTLVNSRQLTAVVPSTDIASAGTATITVTNPSPGGGRSNALFLSIAVPETTVSITNASGSPIPGIRGSFALVAADFNDDGNLDLAAVGSVFLNILLGKGDGTFTQASGSPIFMNPAQQSDPLPDALVVGDFNNDGKLDLAAADFENGINNVPVLLGNGDGAFMFSTGPGTVNSQTLCSLAAADFNEDGNLDLAVGNDIYGRIDVLLGAGDGAFSASTGSPITAPMGACSIAVGDWNGDGKLDLAVVSTGSTSIFLGNGDGTFTPATGSPIAAGSAYGAVVAGDFNGDGKLDLAVTDAKNNLVTILLGNGDGTFTATPASPISVGATPYSIAAGDFRGDGKLDLAVANYGSNDVTLLLGNGDGTFTQAPGSPFSVGNSPASIVFGDFNGSGRPGLATANAGDNTISVLVQ
jgi:VCBS repeat protein/putative Ig domain-containing protein